MQNIVRKGEIACNKQFLLFSLCFPGCMVLIFHLKCTLKCRLQCVLIWTCLKFCRLVMGQILAASTTMNSFLVVTFTSISHYFPQNLQLWPVPIAEMISGEKMKEYLNDHRQSSENGLTPPKDKILTSPNTMHLQTNNQAIFVFDRVETVFYQHFLLFPNCFFAHLSTTCSRGAFRVVRVCCASSSTISLKGFPLPKLLGQFGPNLAGMFLGRSSSKVDSHRI